MAARKILAPLFLVMLALLALELPNHVKGDYCELTDPGTSESVVAAWGDNAAGQLGINSTDSQFCPTSITSPALTNPKAPVVAVAGGIDYSLALDEGTTVIL
jgi:alpha-tubulin suppressor-like RCC1 family protein